MFLVGSDPRKKVSPNRHHRYHCQVLVHSGDTAGECVTRGVKNDLLAGQANCPFALLVDTGKYFDEGRFSGAVITEYARDLTSSD